jgi:glycosyltransferase involved in cell wall biosynthesis
MQQKNKEISFHFWSMAALGKGISGGDRIFIEFARRWSKEHRVTIYVWEEGKEMLERQQLMTDGRGLMIKTLKMGFWCRFGFAICYLARIIRSIVEALRLTIDNQSSTIIYSASEFWMDLLPAFILKIRFPKIKWAAAWYQTAPNPFAGYLWSLPYWLVQLPIKPLISHFADYVLVNNEEERKQFPELNKKGRVIVVLGAVNIDEINRYQSLIINHQPLEIYDAVFQGRFHPQKGVVQLIDIWKKVVEKRPEAKLAMIGDGPLMDKVISRIAYHGLQKNVRLFGYLFDGPEKYRIFSQSKVVVHPAFYDSGGMASAEAMVFSLPVVGFRLKAYDSYYPRGMIKVAVGDIDFFADSVLLLLNDEKKRETLGKEAFLMIKNNWSWDKRAEEVLGSLS